MPDAVFFDILPRFDWAASEAGQNKLISQFDTAAKQISRTFGIEAGNAASGAVDKIAADMRKMQDDVASATTSATNDYRKMILAQGDLQASTQRVVEVTEKFGFESSQATTALARQEAAIVKATQSTDLYTASMGREADAIKASTALQAEHAAAVEQAGSKAAVAGAAFNTAGKVGLAVFAGAVYESGKAAADFQQSQTRLVASAGETQQGMQKVSDGILKMAGDVGYSAGELSKGMYVLESAGYRAANNGLDVLKVAAQGAKNENADLAEVAGGLATTLRDFHRPASEAADVMSKIVAATGMSRGTFQEFSQSLHSVEPLAGSLNIKMEDLFATMAQASQSGASMDQITENMRNALNALSGQSGPARDAMRQLGIDVDDVSQHLGQRGLAGTMQYLADTIKSKMDPNNLINVGEFKKNAGELDSMTDSLNHMSPAAQAVAQGLRNGSVSALEYRKAIAGSTGEDTQRLKDFQKFSNDLNDFSKRYKNGQSTLETYNQALKDVTGTVAGQTIALQVTGDNATKTNQDISTLAATHRELDGSVKGTNETNKTAIKQWADAKAAVGAARIELGNEFLPTLTSVAHVLADVGKFLAEHKSILDTLVLSVGGLAGAWVAVKVAMAMKATFDAIVSGLTFLITKFGDVKAAAMLTATEMQGLGPAAAEGAVGVEAAAAREVTAVDGVTAAANTAKGALKAVGIALAAIVAGKELDELSRKLSPTIHDRFQNPDGTMKSGIDQWIVDNDIPGLKWLEPDDAKSTKEAGAGVDDGKDPGDYKSLDYNPNGAGPAAAADANNTTGPLPTPAAPDSTDPGVAGTVNPIGGGGKSSKDSATAPNITPNLPFHPIDLNLADKPVNESLDEWIDSQKAVTAAMTEVDKSTLDMSKAQADHAALVKKGTATQEEWNNDAARLAQAQLDNQTATQNLTIAQTKAAADANKPGKKREGEGPTGTSILTGDFDFSPKGIASYFTAMLVNLALGNPVGKSEAAKRGTDPNNPLYVSDVGGNGSNAAINADQTGAYSYQPGYGPSGQGAQGGQGGSSANGQTGGGPYFNPGKGAEGWRGTVADTVAKYGAAAGIPASQFGSWTDAIVRQIDTESKGNPGADNPNDSNGRGGTQHVSGLLQYLPSTFQNSAQKLTGITDMMNPVAQIAGALLAGKNAAGAPVDIGNGIGWGPSRQPVDTSLVQNTPIQAPLAPNAVPAAPAAAASASSTPTSPSAGITGSLKDLLFGTGQGLPFNHSLKLSPDSFGGGGDPVPSHETYGARTPGNGLIWSPTKGWVPDGGPGLPLGMTPNAPAAPPSPPPAAPAPGGNPFAPGGALSAMPGAPDPKFGGMGLPPNPGASPAAGSVGPFPVPGSVAAKAPLAPNNVGKPAAGPSMPSAVQGGPSSVIQGQSYGAGQNPGKGFSTSIGSTLAGVAGAMFPGAGAAAAPVGALLDRTIGYAGQVAGIAAGGVLESILPGGAGDKLADPSKSWLGKLALGFAGAHKADGGSDNRAGASAPPVDPKKDDASKQATAAAPAAKIPDQPHQGTGAPPGPGNGNGAPLIGNMSITQNDPVDGNAVGRDIARYSGAMGR